MLVTDIFKLAYPEGIDHADPAVLRMLAETVDSELGRMNADLDAIDYPMFTNGFMAAPQTMYVYSTPDTWTNVQIGTYTYNTLDSSVISGGMHFVPSAEFDYRGVWLAGGTVGVGTIGNVNRIVGRLRGTDRLGPKFDSETYTDYRTEVTKSASGEERLHMSGLFAMQGDDFRFDMGVHIEGVVGQSVTIQDNRTDMWAVRLRRL